MLGHDRIGVMAQVQHCHTDNLTGRIQHRHAAVRKFRYGIRIKNQLWTAYWRVGHTFGHHVRVVRKTRRAPHVRNAVLIPRVVFGEIGQKDWVQLVPIRKLALVEFSEYSDGYQTCGIRRGMHDDVIAGFSGHEFCVNDLGWIVDVVIDFNPVLVLKVLYRCFADVVGPVIYVEDFLAGVGREDGCARGDRNHDYGS